MFVEKQKVLRDAPNFLNRPDQPWQVTVEGDAIVARWKWMDATFFSPHEVTKEVKDYSFAVILGDNGKWKEIDTTQNKSAGIKMNGGKVSLGASSQNFIGKTSQKSFSFGTGVNNQTGEAGLIKFKFDTSLVKSPVRAYLEGCGWKKPGLFG